MPITMSVNHSYPQDSGGTTHSMPTIVVGLVNREQKNDATNEYGSPMQLVKVSSGALTCSNTEALSTTRATEP